MSGTYLDVFWAEDPLPPSADATLVAFPQMRAKEPPRPYVEGDVPVSLVTGGFVRRPLLPSLRGRVPASRPFKEEE